MEPWITVHAVTDTPWELRWGFPFSLGEKKSEHGSVPFNPSIIEEDDFDKFVVPTHKVNEKATKIYVGCL